MRDFLLYLAEQHGGWKKLMKDAQVDPDTHPGWRYPKKKGDPESVGSTPSAIHMLNLLRAVGALNEHFRFPEPDLAEVRATQRAAKAAVTKGERVERRAQDGRGRDGST